MEQRQAEVCRYQGGDPHSSYRHWHIHPNIAFCMTDTFNYLATCLPTSSTSSRIRTRMYPLHGEKRGLLPGLVRFGAWRIARQTMRAVFNEDRAIFEVQQRGIQASRRPGDIGTREERIYQFQDYVCRQTGITSDDAVGAPVGGSTSGTSASIANEFILTTTRIGSLPFAL